jgi:2-polyprenyl-3-methyl-5-hydroxy-6-metoxy-1,4-benzoquinol methylase
MKLPIGLPELRIPADIEPHQMPDLLRYWYLGTRARRHMMMRRFAEVDTRIGGRDDGGELRVLDIGSAWGFNVMALNMLGCRATGMDLVVDQFEVGSRIAGENGAAFDVVGADAARLPFPDESFDVVTMVETFEHVFVEDRPLVVAECGRVLRAGGRFVLSTPNYRSVVERFKRFAGRRRWLRERLPTMCYPEEGTGREDYHPYRYHQPLSDEEIRALLQAGGFRVESVDHFLFMLKNTPDHSYRLVAGLERLFEALPGVRRLAATVCFLAAKP